MNVWQAIRDVLRPRGAVEMEIAQKFKENEVELRTHLRMLDKAATRNLREATDEAAEFRHARKS